jgi:hypothetical protein
MEHPPAAGAHCATSVLAAHAAARQSAADAAGTHVRPEHDRPVKLVGKGVTHGPDVDASVPVTCRQPRSKDTVVRCAATQPAAAAAAAAARGSVDRNPILW